MKIFSAKILFFKSITFRLLIIMVLIVSLFGVFEAIFVTSEAKKQLTRQIQQRHLASSRYIASVIDIEINKSLDFFTELAKDLSKKNFKNEIIPFDRWLREKHIPSVFHYGIVLISADGKGIITESTVIPGRKERSFDQNEWFQKAKSVDRVIISRPFKNTISKAPSIVFAVAVKDANNQVIAVIAGILELDQSELFELLYTPAIAGSGDVLVISPKDKLFVVSNIPEMVLKPLPEPGKNLLLDKALKGHRGVGITVSALGVEEITAKTSIESTGWFVVIKQPTTQALLPVKRFEESLLKYTLLSAIPALIIIITTLNFMLFPLRKAALSVREMAHGSIPLEKLPIAYKDEVGYLIDGFNRLVDTVDERTKALEIANKKLLMLSNTDGLTGIGNRRFFDEKFEQEWSRSSRTMKSLALGMIDVDWFKKYNDHYGHQMGDDCLKQISEVLASSICRAGDITARYGGEEFVFIAPDTDKRSARQIADKFQEALQLLALPHAKSEFRFVTVSIGIAVVTPAREDVSKKLIKAADEALYLAKEQGRNQVVIS